MREIIVNTKSNWGLFNFPVLHLHSSIRFHTLTSNWVTLSIYSLSFTLGFFQKSRLEEFIIKDGRKEVKPERESISSVSVGKCKDFKTLYDKDV